jgi:hypothetical protein
MSVTVVWADVTLRNAPDGFDLTAPVRARFGVDSAEMENLDTITLPPPCHSTLSGLVHVKGPDDEWSFVAKLIAKDCSIIKQIGSFDSLQFARAWQVNLRAQS